MSEQALMPKSEAIINIFSPYFKPPAGFELLRFKQENGLSISEDEKYQYNNCIGDQAMEMLNQIELEQDQIREDLKNVRESHKGISDNTQRQLNLSESIKLSRKLDSLHLKDKLIVEEMRRLEII